MLALVSPQLANRIDLKLEHVQQPSEFAVAALELLIEAALANRIRA